MNTSSKYDQILASLTNNHNMYLPIQIFETLNLYTYDRLFIKTYSKISTSLDIEYCSTLQYQREAFSNDELNLTKQKLAVLSNQQHKLDDIWKESRWLIDVINNVRDRNKINGVSLDFINDFLEKRHIIAKTNVEFKAKESILRKIPLVIVQNENAVDEQNEYSYLSSGYHSDDRFFEQVPTADNSDNLYSSISFINLKNIKPNSKNSKVNIVQNVSPTSSSTSTSSISASASSASSTSSAFYENKCQNLAKSYDDETFSKITSIPIIQNAAITSLTQSFSSLIASVYNYKTIVVHLAVDSMNTTSQLYQFRMVNIKINNSTTAFDVIKYTLGAFDSDTSFKNTSPLSSLYPSLNRVDDTAAMFCLVIVLGCRERVLKDCYCLYQLKDPWIHGRFYIRMVNDALSALKLDKKLNGLKDLRSSSTNGNNLIFSSIDSKV
jgi:hypothetical protein